LKIPLQLKGFGVYTIDAYIRGTPAGHAESGFEIDWRRR